MAPLMPFLLSASSSACSPLLLSVGMPSEPTETVAGLLEATGVEQRMRFVPTLCSGAGAAASMAGVFPSDAGVFRCARLAIMEAMPAARTFSDGCVCIGGAPRGGSGLSKRGCAVAIAELAVGVGDARSQPGDGVATGALSAAVCDGDCRRNCGRGGLGDVCVRSNSCGTGIVIVADTGAEE